MSVASDPSGANVYVDGRFAGQTPLKVAGLTPGDHRIRLVKGGYLENSRIATVNAHGSNTMHVTLTPGRSAEMSVAAQGGSERKWIWIAAGGGAAAAGLYLGLRNHAPDAGSVIVIPTGVGMAGVTTFSFDSNASDEDDDQLTYTWDFGDGAKGTAKTVTHLYSATGTFSVTLQVSDGKAKPVSATGVSVIVAPSVAGTWVSASTLPFFPCGISFTAAQNGGVLTGSFRFIPGAMGCSRPPVALSSGSVSPLTHPSTVTWTSDTFAFAFVPSPLVIEDLAVRFTGTTNPAGDRLAGTLQIVRAGGVVTTAGLTFTR